MGGRFELVNAAAFAGLHVPGELSRSTSDIALGITARSVFSVIADVAYDHGGLPESVALHALWDFVLLEIDALTRGDEPIANSRIAPSALPGSPADTVISPILSGAW